MYVVNNPMLGVSACFLLSGFAALLYQTAWMRLFSIYFGTSEFAVATVLAAYMAGLAIGAWIGGKYANKITRPVWTYGLLEAAIAVSAILVPFLMLACSSLYIHVVGGQPAPPDADGMGQTLFYIVVSFLILLIPTACMGATLPILLRYAVQTDEQVGRRTGGLYAINTAGAVAGTLVAAYVLLPRIGLNGTVFVGVVVNILVFGIAAQLTKTMTIQTDVLNEDQPVTDTGELTAFLFPIIAASGFVSFIYEVLWTRLLGHVLGASVYAFATMLAAFLTGITIGGAIGGFMARRPDSAAWQFALVQLGVAAGAMLSYGSFEWLLLRYEDAHALLAFLIMLPSTVFIGMTFPLAVRIVTHDQRHTSHQAATVYSWNTAGAIIGALTAAFFIIPELGFEGAVRICVLINICLAVITALCCIKKNRFTWAGSTLFITVATVLTYSPVRPEAVVYRELFTRPDDQRIMVDSPEHYYGVGRNSTVLMLEHFDMLSLRTNGLPEADIYRKGYTIQTHSQRWLSLLPVIVRPDSENMMIIGFGGGVAAETIPQSIKQIDIVELEPKVIEANRKISHLRQYDPLIDKRVSIITNDARNALRLTDKNYDIIVSQPSHPWTAGASHLFTREFVTLVKSRLSENGIFLQWMDRDFLDEQLFRDLVATLFSEFNYVRMHQPTGGNFQFVASDAPMDIENYLDRINTLISEEPILYLNNTINSSLDILLTLTLDEHTARAVAKGGHIITDNLNYFATRSNSKGIGLSLQDATLFLQPYDVLLNEDSRFLDKLTDDQVLHLVKKMLFLFMRDRAVLLQQELVKTRADIADLAASLIYFFDKKETQARQTAQKVLNRDPSNELARYMTMRNSIHIVAAGMAHKSLLSNAQEATGELRLLIDGWKSAVEEDWATVAGIDVQLGRIPVTRPWYAETMHLRAEWRARAAAVQPDLARDAALMVELALAQQPSEGLHSLRAYIASGLDDHDTMFSSFRSSGSFILNRIVGAEQGIAPLQDSERQDMIGRIDATLQALNLDIPVNQDPRAHYLRDSFQALRQSALAAP